MTRRPSTILRTRRGMTLIEVALSLGVLALILVGLAQLLITGSEYLRSRAVADRMEQVQNAAEQYVERNSATLLQMPELAAGNSFLLPVTGAGTFGGSLTSIQASGFLPSSFVNTNSYGQSHAVILKRIGTGQRLEGLVTTTGGTVIQDRTLGQIGGLMGADGGFLLSLFQGAPTATITGVGGGWSTAASNWTGVPIEAGHVMSTFAFAEGELVGDYLNRHDIGIVEANTMRTDLFMGTDADLRMENNKINDVKSIDGNGIVASFDGRIGGEAEKSLNINSYVSGKRFIDQDNRTFFVDPASQSNLNDVKAVNVDAQYLNTNAIVHTGDRSGKYIRLKDRLPNYVAKQGWFIDAPDQTVPFPVCPPNISAKITFSPITESYWFASNVQYDSDGVSSGGQNIPNLVNNDIAIARRYNVFVEGQGWRIRPEGTDFYSNGQQSTFSGLAMTYCYYPD